MPSTIYAGYPNLLTKLAADIAARVPDMSRDSALNNADLIEGLLETQLRSGALAVALDELKRRTEERDRLRDALSRLISRAAYVCQHRYDAVAPIGTRLVAIDDLREEIDRAAKALL